ncbi:MAG: c-type cytochrome, partial [bacterium]
SYFAKVQTDWTGSLDDWQWPLRPANLNTGVYKGGRRPIDIYWRIAKGINGAKMPAHETTLKPEQIWDIVNFVLALPERPELLRDATEPVRNDAPAKVAAN